MKPILRVSIGNMKKTSKQSHVEHEVSRPKNTEYLNKMTLCSK
jgi:hypothetical protein